MTPALLQHSDQIVATLAKLPLSLFGTPRTKEVMIVIDTHMNKAKDWTAWPSVPTIAEKVDCCVRTVRYALRRLEGISFISTEEGKRKDDPRMNTAKPPKRIRYKDRKVYTVGPALLRILAEKGVELGPPEAEAMMKALMEDER